MDSKRMSVFVVVCFFICIGIMDYPFISRLYNEQIQGTVVAAYETAAERLQDDRKAKELQKAEKYNEWLYEESSGFEDAFWKSRQISDMYRTILNIGKETEMAVLEIPKIQIRLPVYHGTEEEVLQKGAGHLEGSSVPAGGKNTHTCILAHRGLPQKELFSKLDRMETGDLFYLHVLGDTLAYEVYQTEVVLPEDTDGLDILYGEDIATLITCTPYGINTHRLYVHGRRVAIPQEKEKWNLKNIVEQLKKQAWIVLTVLIMVWMLILLYWLNKRPGRKRRRKCMKKKKKWKKPVLNVLVCAGCIGLSCMTAEASKGSIRIEFRNLEYADSCRADLKVLLYRIGRTGADGLPVFEPESLTVNDPGDREEVADTAKKAISQTERLQKSEVTTDSQGVAVFEDLQEGIYLVMVPNENSYGIVDPFLVTIPYYEETDEGIKGPLYEVIAAPKAVPNEKEQDVKTADASETGVYLGISTFALFTAAIVRHRRSSETEET